MSSRTASGAGAPIRALLPPPRISRRRPCAPASRTASITSASCVGRSCTLEPRQVGEAGLAAVDVDPAQLGATVQYREHLPGIEEQVRIEGALDPLLMGQV